MFCERVTVFFACIEVDIIIEMKNQLISFDHRVYTYGEQRF